MNCTDFVHLVLHKAGMLSKEQIIRIYKDEVDSRVSNEPITRFYGFDLSRFQPFDPVNGSKNRTAEEGDLLIGFSNGTPQHILFLSGKEPNSQEWQGIGLWHIGSPKIIPSNIELRVLQEELQDRDGGLLTFMHCPLNEALPD